MLTARLEQFFRKYAPDLAAADSTAEIQNFKAKVAAGSHTEQQLAEALERKYGGYFPKADEVAQGLFELAAQTQADAEKTEVKGVLLVRNW